MQPSVQSLDQILAELNPLYDPQRQAIKQNIDYAQQGETALLQQQDALKTQAFGDIAQTAQDRGMYFSGFQPDQQAQYLGTTYLPTVAKIRNDTQQRVTGLNTDLSNLEAGVRKSAMDTQQGQQEAAVKWQQEQQRLLLEQQKLAQELAIAQMRDQATIRAAQIRSAGSGTLTAYQQAQLLEKERSKYSMKQENGNPGFNFYGPGGQPISMFQYAQATGTGMLDLLKRSNNEYDKHAYTMAAAQAQYGRSEEQILQALQKNYPNLF
jgi:hypothetical protein